MKKFFTLTMLLVAALAVNASNRHWSFTNWSPATVSKLAADMAQNGGSRWTHVEKDNGDGDTGGNCYWWNQSGKVQLTTLVDGIEEIIPETAGLYFGSERARSLALAINYQTSFDNTAGPFSGPKYVWVGSSNQTVTIPEVKPGARITVEVESHKVTEARGFSMTVNGNHVDILEGSEKPIERTTCVWIVPADITDATVDVVLKNSNGSHMYSIDVNEDGPAVDGANIAFFYDSSYPNYSLDDDMLYQMLSGNEFFNNTTVEAIDVAGDVSAINRDALCEYDVVVLSGAISETNAFAQTLKSAIAYTPILNLGTNLYKAWGLGSVATTTAHGAFIDETYRDYPLFEPRTTDEPLIDTDGVLYMTNESTVNGVEFAEGSYFAGDPVIGTADGKTAIHIHNQKRNAYMLLPYGDMLNDAYENVYDVLTNATAMLKTSKQAVTNAAAPTFEESYNHLNTDVTIKSATAGAKIYYTIAAPGTEPTDPTMESTPYTGPINVDAEGTVVSAIAYADGYNPSEVSRQTVSIYTTSAQPEVKVAREEGKTTITIENNEPEATVYYSINGSTNPIECGVYTEPLTITHHVTLTAFAGEVTGKKQSEAVVKEINVDGEKIRIDELASFDANKTDWSCGESKVKYYTEGKKNGYNFYNVEETIVKDQYGEDSTAYTILGPADVVTEHNPGNGWIAKSYGQGMLWERLSINADIDNTNDAGRYRAETAFDVGANDDCITFGSVRKSDGANSDPYSGKIYSTQKFQGPFDIVTWVGNGSTGMPVAEIYVSTDTLSEANWVKVGDLAFAGTQRWLKKTTLGYEGTDEVFVKLQPQSASVQVYNIKIMYAGEKSEEYVTGIEDVNNGSAATSNVVRTLIYNINGTQTGKLAKGINIIREVYANGQSKTRKVVVK